MQMPEQSNVNLIEAGGRNKVTDCLQHSYI